MTFILNFHNRHSLVYIFLTFTLHFIGTLFIFPISISVVPCNIIILKQFQATSASYYFCCLAFHPVGRLMSFLSEFIPSLPTVHRDISKCSCELLSGVWVLFLKYNHYLWVLCYFFLKSIYTFYIFFIYLFAELVSQFSQTGSEWHQFPIQINVFF